jgi:hypothetical protein
MLHKKRERLTIRGILGQKGKIRIDVVRGINLKMKIKDRQIAGGKKTVIIFFGGWWGIVFKSKHIDP